MDNIYGIIIIIIIAIIFYINYKNKGGFALPPDKSVMYNTIIQNKELFTGSNYQELKSRITWMDAGIYNDVKQLIREKKQLNQNNLSVIFRKSIF